MLMAVVLVFLVCHSVKLVVSSYEVYREVTGRSKDPSEPWPVWAQVRHKLAATKMNPSRFTGYQT